MTAPVALFGTSADPPTLGHQTLLLQLLEHYPPGGYLGQRQPAQTA
jgi:nicotinic acid mononucleotide adenylyltransferase